MKTQKHNMSAERYQELQVHQRFYKTLAGWRMYLGQTQPVTAVFGFVQRVMNRHKVFALRLSARRRLDRYFSGLNFVFALPLVHVQDKFSLRTIERLIATRPLFTQFFHTTEAKTIWQHAGSRSLAPNVVPLLIAQRYSPPLAGGIPLSHSVAWSPIPPRGSSLGEGILNANMSLSQPRRSMFALSQQRLITNLFYNSRNIFTETKLGIKREEVVNRPRREWPKQGLSLARQFSGSTRHASAARVEDVGTAPKKSYDDLVLETAMPRAEAEATDMSHHQTFSDLQNLITAQPRFPDFSPEKRFMEHSSGKNYTATATVLELTHKAHPTADGKSQAQPPEENGNNNTVARRQSRPVGIAESPPPEAFKSIDHLADQVITIIEKRLQTERERRGIFF